MIILPEPNNDLWIYDEKELEGFDYKIVKTKKGAIENIYQHTYKEFCHILAGDNHYLPRKWTNSYNGYWDCNPDIKEIFNSLCINKIEYENISVYEMSWGEVFMFYTGIDSGGYDACTKIDIFENVFEYNSTHSLFG